MPRKIQMLRLAADGAHPEYTSVPNPAVRDLLDLAQATADYFGYPKKAKPGVHREGRDKFNALLDQLDKFDFGVYAPDELREEDFRV